MSLMLRHQRIVGRCLPRYEKVAICQVVGLEVSSMNLSNVFVFYNIAIFFQQLLYLWVYHEHTIPLGAVVIVIIFVIVLCWIKVSERCNFRNNRLFIGARFF